MGTDLSLGYLGLTREKAIMNADKLGRLVFLLSRTEGRYAVLLGSGISSAAGIPTGWGIAMDLIKQMAISNPESTDGHGLRE